MIDWCILFSKIIEFVQFYGIPMYNEFYLLDMISHQIKAQTDDPKTDILQVLFKMFAALEL